ncbi:MAG: NAD(+) synthase, partial [Cytophagales bacterium]
GNEAGRIIYDGELMIASPSQGLVAKNQRFRFEKVQMAIVEFEELSAIEVQPNFDVYEKEQELLGALTLGLYDYLRKSHSKGFVLSLSGGADSSICAVMVAEMIKKGINTFGLKGFLESLGIDDLEINEENVIEKLFTCVYQWSKNSSWDTFESAQALAQDIKAKFFSWRIDKEVASFTDNIEVSLQRKLKWQTDDIALQNIQARARSPIVWMLANINRALLITTSNRSEGDVGYATMDGDTSGSIAPIAGLDKDFIRKWLVWAEQELGYVSLEHVNQLAPSAELRPQEMTQTDETDLMPYHVLLEIEKMAIREWKSPKEVFELLKSKNLCNEEQLKTYIKKFFKLWSFNQWKRERLAPSFLLDDFNVDPRTWCRFPILSGGFEDELKML